MKACHNISKQLGSDRSVLSVCVTEGKKQSPEQYEAICAVFCSTEH